MTSDEPTDEPLLTGLTITNWPLPMRWHPLVRRSDRQRLDVPPDDRDDSLEGWDE